MHIYETRKTPCVLIMERRLDYYFKVVLIICFLNSRTCLTMMDVKVDCLIIIL